ncbi:hypothetical protein, partial [Rhodoplanes roseus]
MQAILLAAVLGVLVLVLSGRLTPFDDSPQRQAVSTAPAPATPAPTTPPAPSSQQTAQAPAPTPPPA